MWKRYLKLELNPSDESELDAIVDALRTTIDRDPIISQEDGCTYLELLTDTELMRESFCLGMCFRELEEDGIEHPFLVTVVMLDEAPQEAQVTH